MPVIKHQHKINCPCGEDFFIHYLIDAAPEILWFNVQDVGSNKGRLYAVGLYQGEYLIYENDYGSCQQCGEVWGGGDEPVSLEDVLKLSNIFYSPEKAKEYVLKIGPYDSPDIKAMEHAINEITTYVQTK